MLANPPPLRVFRSGYVLYRDPADAELGAASAALARSMQMPLVWGHHFDPEVSKRAALNEEKGSRTTLYGAYLHRKPSAYCETNGTGGVREEDVASYVEGVQRALGHLTVLPGGHPLLTVATPRLDTIDVRPAAWFDTAAAAAAEQDPSKASSGHLQSQNCTPVAGLWRAKVDLWDTVASGDLIGTVSDHFGNVLFEQRAAKPGTVILLRFMARVEAGDFLLVIV